MIASQHYLIFLRCVLLVALLVTLGPAHGLEKKKKRWVSVVNKAQSLGRMRSRGSMSAASGVAYLCQASLWTRRDAVF